MGESPRDLDSHLTYTEVDKQIFHIYYNHKSYKSGVQMKADLDLDDKNSYGPE